MRVFGLTKKLMGGGKLAPSARPIRDIRQSGWCRSIVCAVVSATFLCLFVSGCGEVPNYDPSTRTAQDSLKTSPEGFTLTYDTAFIDTIYRTY